MSMVTLYVMLPGFSRGDIKGSKIHRRNIYSLQGVTKRLASGYTFSDFMDNF